MECRFVGWPADGPRLDLDHRQFSYAGKFVMPRTGKAVVEDGEDVIAAASFSPDRTDDDVWWIRIVTVRRDRRGVGLGPQLLDYVAVAVLDRAASVRIAVNNPFAFEAAYKAGFGYTGETTGLAELVCERPTDRDPAAYRAGLDAFRGREDLPEAEQALLAARDGTVPPLVARSG